MKFIFIVSLLDVLMFTNRFVTDRVHTQFGDYDSRLHSDYKNPYCGLKTKYERKYLNLNQCLKGKKSLRELMSVSEKTIRNRNITELNPRIFNGENAIQYEAPWTALLTVTNGLQCGGVILNKKWILTAAHCFGNNTSGNISVGNINPSQTRNYSIEKLIKHKSYSKDVCHNDIGLVKSKNSITFSTLGDTFMVNSICLPKNGLTNSREELATMYGWGTDSNVTFYVGIPLQKGEFKLKAFNECHGMESLLNCYCTEHNSEFSTLACLGDSGSGLIQFIGPKKRAVVIGIMSTASTTNNITICGDRYSAFSPVSLQIDWILDTMINN